MADMDSESAHMIIESLRYTKQTFQTYEYYASEDQRRERLADVDRTIAVVRALRAEAKARGK